MVRFYRNNYKIEYEISCICEFCLNEFQYRKEFEVEWRYQIENKIEKKDFEPVPCPSCGYIQSWMLQQAKSDFSFALIKPLTIIYTIALLVTIIALLIILENVKITWKLITWIPLIIIIALFMGVFCAIGTKDIIELFYRPNKKKKSKNKFKPLLKEISVEEIRHS